MEKIKSILSPGKDKDDEQMYGTGNSGVLQGEGSHFPGSTTTGTGAGNTSGIGASTGPVQGNTTSGLGHQREATTVNPATAAELGNPNTSTTHSSTTHPTGTTGHSSTTNPLSSNHPSQATATGGYGSTGTSGMPGTFNDELSSSQHASQVPSSSTAGQHTGRDAAMGLGGAAALGEGIHHHQESTRAAPTATGNFGNTGSTTQQPSAFPTSSTTGQHTGTNASGLGGAGSTTSGTGYPMNTPPTSGSGLGQGTTGYGSTQQPTTTTNTSHHLGRDAAIGAGTVGGAAALGEGIHHHRDNETSAQNVGSSGYSGTTASGATAGTYYGGPQGSAVSQGPHQTGTANALDPSLHGGTTRSNLESGHDHSTSEPAIGGGAEEADTAHVDGHKGRDTALGLGAAGAGGAALAHHKHDKDLTQAERDAKKEHKHELKEEKKLEHERKHAHDTHGSSSGAATTSTTHHGRDAALGAGAGAGAVGLAEHEKNKQTHSTTSDPATDKDLAFKQNLPGPAPNTAGPHSKDWMNKLDPRVDSTGGATGSTGSRATTDSTGTTHAMQNRSAYVDPEARNNPGFVDSPQHPVGRSAGPGAVGIGGVAAGAGAAGLGAHELGKHHEGSTANPALSSTSGTTTGATTTTGTGPIGTGATTGTTSSTTGATTTDPSHKDHHYGRDAAGAGVVGGAAYEAEKHHHQDKDLKHAEKEAKKEEKHEHKQEKSSSGGGLLSFLHRDKNKKYTKEEEDEFDRQEREHNSHKGRDAALGAGAAGVGAGAYEHQKHDKDLSKIEKEERKEEKHAEKERLKEHKKEEKSSGGGILSFLHRDKNKKYTKEEEEEFDRQEREHNSHAGRNTAIGAGAAGAVGAGAYGAEQHHQHGTTADTNKALPLQPGASATGTSRTGQDLSVTDHHNPPVGGKWEGGEGAEYAEPGTTLGDHLHGVDRNRGVANPNTTDGRHRLHKDPPSSHPAAQGGVTADGQHIEPGTGKLTSTPIYDQNATGGTLHGTPGTGVGGSNTGTGY